MSHPDSAEFGFSQRQSIVSDKIYGIIPARIASSRLPRKLLLAETGRPLIQYAWEAARQSSLLADVIIATDSPEIADVASGFGARVEMTGDHPSGSDRIAEVVRRCCGDAEMIVNIQGDEPEIEPGVIDRLAGSLQNRPQFEMATLATPIGTRGVLEDLACVKVVRGADGRALYFSRLPIPHAYGRSVEELLPHAGDDERIQGLQESPWLLHLGIYAYCRPFLLALSEMPRSRLEQLESLEQLRVLEAGASIYVEIVPHRSVGIDTADDYARFVARQKGLRDREETS